LLVGASGLVGRACLAAWLAEPEAGEIVALVRRPLPHVEPSARLRVEVVDFARLAERPDLLAVDHVVSALGTTRRRAGSRAAFRAVDHDLALTVATLARAAGARHFLVVSAVGADSRSAVFYNRVKGELEEALTGLGFPSLTIARPSFLLGERDEPRPAEALGGLLGGLLPGAFKPVHATQVARALLDAARRDEPGRRVLDNRALRSFPLP
jgi:uncharacterized protein YbjT (DUF2867 family)